MTKTNQRLAWIGAVAIAVGSAASAQTSTPCPVPVALGATLASPVSVTSVPYSATVKTTQDQTLADGSVVHRSVTTHQARDAAGKLFEEESFGCPKGPDGERHPVLRKFIYDPRTGTTISWNADDPAKVLRAVHGPPRVAPPAAAKKTESPEADRRALKELGIDPGEDLGSKKIAGVMADGNRTAGPTTLGHKIVDETWNARNLGLQVLRITDNSSTGRTTVAVVSLQQGDPDPALFAPPVGYKIEELPHNTAIKQSAPQTSPSTQHP